MHHSHLHKADSYHHRTEATSTIWGNQENFNPHAYPDYDDVTDNILDDHDAGDVQDI